MKVGVFTAGGFGDGLIMMLVASALQKEGFTVVVYNNHLTSFLDWFGEIFLEKTPSFDTVNSFAKSLDLIFLQHDNSPLAKALIHLRKKSLRVVSFYTTHQEKKHGSLHQDDYVLDHQKPILHGLQEAMTQFLGKQVSRDIGMKPWAEKKRPSRKVVLHPFSTDPAKNWPTEKFVQLANRLVQLGYLPYFCMSPDEKARFFPKNPQNICIPTLLNLSELVDLLSDAVFFIGNDSGPGHLASYMNIPSIILSGGQCIQHWQPGWKPATIIQPPKWIPNMQGAFRMRQRFWKRWISVRKVLKEFCSLIDEESQL